MQQHNKQLWFKITVAVLAYGFLIYKAATFTHWQELNLFQKDAYPVLLLTCTILLMPFNIFTEAWHWRFTVSPIAKLSFYASLKMVLGGMIPGLITPSKIGEWPGRASFFPPELKKRVTALAAFAGFVKTAALGLAGIAALILLGLSNSEGITDSLFLPAALIVSVLLLLLIGSRFIAKPLLNLNRFRRHIFATDLKWLNGRYRLKSLLIAGLRMLIMYVQFWLLVSYFNIDISTGVMIMYIPVYFMILTFLPAFSIADPALRGSVAILLFSDVTQQTPMIAFAGIMLWFINNLLPVISGTFIWIRKPAPVNPVSQKQSFY